MPDSFLAKVYCNSLGGTAALADASTPRPKPKRITKNAKNHAWPVRCAGRDRQLAFKLVCKAWSQCAGYAVTKGTLTEGILPPDLHLRFGGLHTLTLIPTELPFASFQSLGQLR